MSRVLLVDDDRPLLTVLHRGLTEAGFAAEAVSSGRSALEWLQREAFDLVVTDLYMPDLDGFELLLAVRNSRKFVPVVVMSGGYESLNMLQAVRSLGAVHALSKPFSMLELVGLAAQILERSPIPNHATQSSRVRASRPAVRKT